MSATVPQLKVEIAFASPALGPFPTWVNVSSRVRDTEPVTIRRGRNLELNRVEAGRATLALDNRDRRFDPWHTGSPYSPNVRPYRLIRISAIWQSVTYPLFTGFCRFLPQWSDGGSRESLCRVEAVDVLDYFARMLFSVDLVYTWVSAATSISPGTLDIPGGGYLKVRMTSPPSGTVTFRARGYDLLGVYQEEIFSLSAANYDDGVTGGVAYDYLYQFVIDGNVGKTYEIYSAPAYKVTFSDQQIGWTLDVAGIAGIFRRLDPGDVEMAQWVTTPAAGWAPTLRVQSTADTVLAALQRIVDTEGGLLYIAGDGTVVFENQSRRRHSYLAPLSTFGTGAGELPYRSPTVDDGEALIYNQARITPEGYPVQVVDTDDGVAEYGRRTYQRTIISSLRGYALIQARNIVSDYKDPVPRITGITPVGDATTGAPWPLLLGAELSQIHRVRARPPGGGTPITQISYLESIAWTIRRGTWVTQWGLSPAAQTNDLYTLFDGGDGVAFPTSPAQWMRFFRTDLNLLCFYDGARWLTVQQYVATIPTLSASGDSTGGHTELRQDWAPYIERIAVSRLISTTNNGSNYWTLFIRGVNAAYGSTTTILSISSAALAANVWSTSDNTSFTTRTPADRARVDVYAQKTGAPGVVAANITVYYRLIVT